MRLQPHAGHLRAITGAVADRTLPEEVIAPTTLPTPVALPPVKSDLTRGTVDAVYDINRRISVGLTYWYDKTLCRTSRSTARPSRR